MSFKNFHLFNELNETVVFQYQYSDCYKCLKTNFSIKNNQSLNFAFFQNFMVDFSVYNKTGKICRDSTNFKGNESYNYYIQSRTSNISSEIIKCSLLPVGGDGDFMLPFYICLILLCLCSVLYYAGLMIYRHRLLYKLGSKFFLYQVDSLLDLGQPSIVSPALADEDLYSIEQKCKSKIQRRIKSVDTFRGISIVLMIFVNYGGGNYFFMEHSVWNGLTVADLVFPWFVFVMGVTVAFSFFKSSLKKMHKMFLLHFWLRSVKRSIILFLIGIILENRDKYLGELRIMGPLQRLAISYFCLITAICVVSTCGKVYRRSKSTSDLENEFLISSNEVNLIEHENRLIFKCQEIFPDLIKCFPYIFLIFGLLIAHACISLLLNVHGCPRGYLGPGGIGDNGCCNNCTGGVAGYIDRLILTPNHLYQTPTCRKLYNTTQPFDPEGILGNLTSTALCFIGFWAGNVMLINKDWTAITKRLFIYAVICAAAGAGLCECQINGGLIPINKNLWSVSFVLITGGMGLFLLGAIFATVDVFQIWSGSPFKYPGMNAIVIYAGHILLESSFPVQWKIGAPPYDHTFKLLMNVWGVVFWSLVGYVMFLKNMFIAV